MSERRETARRNSADAEWEFSEQARPELYRSGVKLSAIYPKKAHGVVKKNIFCISGLRPLPLFLCLILLIPTIVPGTATEPASVAFDAKRNLLAGTWKGGVCTYSFEAGDVLRVLRNDCASSDSLRCRYSWFRMGSHDCIALQPDEADNLSLQVLLIGETTESIAVIALGTPFVRIEGGEGINGIWKHMEPFTRVEWKLGVDTVEYRYTFIDPVTGREQVREVRNGVYRRANDRYEEGSLEVVFRDGNRAVVLPVVYKDMMYLFDLSPAKSLFGRVRESTAVADPLAAEE